MIGWFSSHKGVPGGSVFQANGRGNIAGVNIIDLLTVIGIHPQQTADPFFLTRGRVQNIRPFFQITRINPEKSQRPDIRIGRHFKRQRRERFIVGRTAQNFRLALRLPFPSPAANPKDWANNSKPRQAPAERRCFSRTNRKIPE